MVSRLGLGLAAVGRPGYITLGRARDLPADRTPDALAARTFEICDAAWAHGVRYFDVARSYGRAEEFLARWLAARAVAPDTVSVGSKWGYRYTAGWQVEAAVHEEKQLDLARFESQLAESRSVLGAQLDLYQIHSATAESGCLTDERLLAAMVARPPRRRVSRPRPVAQRSDLRPRARARARGARRRRARLRRRTGDRQRARAVAPAAPRDRPRRRARSDRQRGACQRPADRCEHARGGRATARSSARDRRRAPVRRSPSSRWRSCCTIRTSTSRSRARRRRRNSEATWPLLTAPLDDAYRRRARELGRSPSRPRPTGRRAEACPGPRDPASEADALAEALNRSCHCIAVDPAKLRSALESSPLTMGIYDAILRERPHLFSSSPVFLARAQLEHMQTVITAIEHVIASAPFRASARAFAPPDRARDFGPRGVFLGYDFHVGRTRTRTDRDQHQCRRRAPQHRARGGPAGVLRRRRGDARCRVDPGHARRRVPRHVPRRMAAPTRRRAARNDRDRRRRRPRASTSIPSSCSSRSSSAARGFQALIADPRALRHVRGALYASGERIDLVYNRLTDFDLRRSRDAPRCAARTTAGDVVVTPNPHTTRATPTSVISRCFSDGERLRDWGIPAETIAMLAAGVPRTVAGRACTPRRALARAQAMVLQTGSTATAAKPPTAATSSRVASWEPSSRAPTSRNAIVPPSERTIRIDERECRSSSISAPTSTTAAFS